MRRSLLIPLLAVVTAMPACRQAPLQGPPQVRLGRDLCAECGMIISDEACSSATLIERDGVREHALFDDIGCMLDFERKQEPAVRTIDEFVRDYGDHKWSHGASASYLVVDDHQIRTPMGSGIVAYAGASSAVDAAKRLNGRVVTRAQLAVIRAGTPQERESGGGNRPAAGK